MIRILFIAFTVLVCSTLSLAQTSGNVGYSQSGSSARAKQNERNKKAIPATEAPPTGTTMFVDASVMINVKADEFVAVFGVAQECATVPECNQKIDETIKGFSGSLRQLGVGTDDIYVDYVAQNKIYGYKVTENVAKESLVGFELKKNVSVHYKDKALLDRMVIAASQAKIFDLIKVDYIVKDTAAVQDKLMDEAAKVIKGKTARYEKLLSVKLQSPGQIYAERPSIYYPTQMYDSYVAEESEEMSVDNYRQKYAIQNARKGRTFFFNALDADGFDYVINPVVIEPVVQFTLYLKVKYEIDSPAKAPKQ